MKSSVPNPLSRLDTEEAAKISAISASGASARGAAIFRAGVANGRRIVPKRFPPNATVLTTEALTSSDAAAKLMAVISVTSKSRYAVVALAELARSGSAPVPIGTIAERRGMPVQFLEQLFATLRRSGILTSHRGVKGGYTLSRPADDITVLEVVQALDGRVGEEGKEAGGSGRRAWRRCGRSSRKRPSKTLLRAIQRPLMRGCTTSDAHRR